MEPVWKYPASLDRSPDIELLIQQEANLEPLIWQLLLLRGISTRAGAEAFLKPSLLGLHDPFLMADMDRAVRRLDLAFSSAEKVLIYGDYDVDGTTAVAMVYGFLSARGLNCSFYIPDRFKEGYGFSMAGVEYAAEQDYTLIITLDCGIKDGLRIERCRELGIDVIVCDHHKPSALPPAFAVLDPIRSDCSYPDKGLSGCGVGFKLLQGWCRYTGHSEDDLMSYLDLLSISIGADIVPVVGENRILAREGLEVLNRTKRPGIRRMLELAGFNKSRLTISDVVFTLAPRINAAGRIMSGRNAVRLLLSEDPTEVEELSRLIEGNNVTRKSLDKGITESAIRMVGEDAFYTHSFSTVVRGTEWNKGVVGIVASRLVETFYKPSVVLVDNGEVLAGSARSIPGIDLYELLGKCQDLLIQYGGHTMAAGLSLRAENFLAFRERFDKLTAAALSYERPVPELAIDLEVEFGDLTDRMFRQLMYFEPFGPANMKPVFLARHCTDAGGSRLVGNPAEHLKLRLRQQASGRILDGIAFFSREWAPTVLSGKPVDIVFTIEPNEYNGRTTMQLVVEALREHVPGEQVNSRSEGLAAG